MSTNAPTYNTSERHTRLLAHQAELRDCRRCPAMLGPVVLSRPVLSPILQIGQAPGPYEGKLGQPFAWTAGKTLFKWYATLGVTEEAFRSHVYMAAVCRCFPGKQPKGGDRVPDKAEIAHCGHWLAREVDILRPRLVIPVGKLAIARLLTATRLDDVVGQVHAVEFHGWPVEVIPLPHPSGLSTWFKTEPGRTLLGQALARIGAHPAWRETFAG